MRLSQLLILPIAILTLNSFLASDALSQHGCNSRVIRSHVVHRPPAVHHHRHQDDTVVVDPFFNQFSNYGFAVNVNPLQGFDVDRVIVRNGQVFLQDVRKGQDRFLALGNYNNVAVTGAFGFFQQVPAAGYLPPQGYGNIGQGGYGGFGNYGVGAVGHGYGIQQQFLHLPINHSIHDPRLLHRFNVRHY
jgi:hypothetical protein